MAQQPIVVTVPHKLGKDEARRRLDSGLARAGASFGGILTLTQQNWTGDRLEFSASAMGQAASGAVDVGEDNIRIEVTLPWLLHQMAQKATDMIRKQGQLLLEKK